jgi:hypothetical protein
MAAAAATFHWSSSRRDMVVPLALEAGRVR